MNCPNMPLSPVNLHTDTAVWGLDQRLEVVDRVNHASSQRYARPGTTARGSSKYFRRSAGTSLSIIGEEHRGRQTSTF
jgi:hypothetical protein